MNEETKRKISLALKGRKKPPRSEKHKKKLSDVFKGKSYEERFGKKRAEEIKKKMGEAHQGKRRYPFTDEWKNNLSKSLKGRIAWNKDKKGLQIAWNKIYVSKNTLYKKYIIDNKSANKIAKELNCSRETIVRCLKQYALFRVNRKSTYYIKNMTLEEIHGRENAKIIKGKLSKAARGRKITWNNKISEGIKKHYNNNGFPDYRRKQLSELHLKKWRDPKYREKLIMAHKNYLKKHPEELMRLKKIQCPGSQQK